MSLVSSDGISGGQVCVKTWTEHAGLKRPHVAAPKHTNNSRDPNRKYDNVTLFIIKLNLQLFLVPATLSHQMSQ